MVTASGTTINIPLPGGSGELTICEAFDTIVAEAAQRFRPDVILVAAGYDAHWYSCHTQSGDSVLVYTLLSYPHSLKEEE